MTNLGGKRSEKSKKKRSEKSWVNSEFHTWTSGQVVVSFTVTGKRRRGRLGWRWSGKFRITAFRSEKEA